MRQPHLALLNIIKLFKSEKIGAGALNDFARVCGVDLGARLKGALVVANWLLRELLPINNVAKSLKVMVHPTGFEPVASAFGGKHS